MMTNPTVLKSCGS